MEVLSALTAADVGTRFSLSPDYHVQFALGDHIILQLPMLSGSPGARVEHANLLAKREVELEFKHSRKDGSKYWRSKAGVELFFAVPKSAIELVPEKGYSYVPVWINGHAFTLDVSGGTFDGWTDSVGVCASTLVGYPEAAILALAEVAATPLEFAALGLHLPDPRG